MQIVQYIFHSFWFKGFALGMLGGLHCAYMCTPLVLFFTQNAPAKLVVIYHTFRIYAYTLMGLLMAAFGKFINSSQLCYYFSIAIGLVLVLHVLGYLKKMPLLSQLNQYFFQKSCQTKNNLYAKYIFLGMANGFLPCGVSATAIITASIATTPTQGLFFMWAFGLGTTLVLAATHFISLNSWLPYLKPNTKIITISVASLLILRGLQLNIPLLSPAPVHANIVPNASDTWCKLK